MGPKKQGFWPRINCSQILGLHPVTVCQKLGVILVNKVVLKLKSAKNVFYKKCVPKLIFFNENVFRNIGMIFDIENSFENPKLALFDQLSPDGDSKSGNFI